MGLPEAHVVSEGGLKEPWIGEGTSVSTLNSVQIENLHLPHLLLPKLRIASHPKSGSCEAEASSYDLGFKLRSTGGSKRDLC